MNDQAAELRNLVLRSRRFNMTSGGPDPRLVVLTGGKGGVGTTSLAVNVAIATAQNGSRTVLVDADLYRADAAAMCGIGEQGSVADVLAGRHDIHEVLQLGPGGIQLVPGVWAGGEETLPTKSPQRLTSQLKTLGRFADVVILDSGSRASDIVKEFWEAADDVIVVTTPDPLAVMDCYATLKTLGDKQMRARCHLLVNKCPGSEAAEDVCRRIDQSCRRFLNTRIQPLGHVPDDALLAASADQQKPLLVQSPQAAATIAIQQISAALLRSSARPASRESATA